MEKSGAISGLRVFVGLKRMIEESFWFCLQQYCLSEKNG